MFVIGLFYFYFLLTYGKTTIFFFSIRWVHHATVAAPTRFNSLDSTEANTRLRPVRPVGAKRWSRNQKPESRDPDQEFRDREASAGSQSQEDQELIPNQGVVPLRLGREKCRPIIITE